MTDMKAMEVAHTQTDWVESLSVIDPLVSAIITTKNVHLTLQIKEEKAWKKQLEFTIFPQEITRVVPTSSDGQSRFC